MNETDLQALMPAIVDLAKQAGERVMRVYSRPFEVTQKDDDTPLTEADQASNAMIAAGLSRLTPDIPLMSEENEMPTLEERRQWREYWLVDPLDGTREFIKRNDEFTVNIALIRDGEPVLGVVYAPALDITYYGHREGGAFKQFDGEQPEPIRVRKPAEPPFHVAVSRSHRKPEIDEIVAKLPDYEAVSVGSSLKFCMVAEGKVNFYPRIGPTSEWDSGAAQAVVEAAGGRVTNLDMKPLCYNRKESLLNPDFVVFGDTDHDWGRYLAGIDGTRER